MWLRTWPISGVMYEAKGRASLRVVTDGEAGATVTYTFRIPSGEPAHCTSSTDGNGVRCP